MDCVICSKFLGVAIMNEVIENETFQDRAFERESFGRLWKYFFSAATAIGSVIFLLGLFVGLGFATILILILAIAVGVMGFNVMSAKSRAVAKREVAIWGGLCKIVSWNPTEGVLFLKNKMNDGFDDNPDDGGGVRAIFPIFGEELVCRVPLEVQTLNFEDNEVLTKEFLPLKIKGTIYWTIHSLPKFYKSVSKEVHTIDNRGHHNKIKTYENEQMNTADTWLRSMAEEKTRSVVSGIGTGLLMADRLAQDIPSLIPINKKLPSTEIESSDGYRSATESLAVALTDAVGADVSDYGITVKRIALQEVNLPPEIYAAAVEASQSSYGLLKARAEAIAKQMSLRAETDVLGADVVGMREIAANIPALAFQDILGPTFAKLAATLGKTAQSKALQI